MRRDFGLLAEPFTLHDPVPALLAGFWMLCRETTLVGCVPRAHKEAVATAISAANRCPYCVDAHVMMLHAAGAHGVAAALAGDGAPADPGLRAVVSWARATRAGGAAILADPPMRPAEVPELVGTAVAFHYVNRMVSVLLDPSPFPALWKTTSRRLLGWVVSRTVRRAKAPGASLHFLPEAALPADLAWAAASPTVAAAVARFATAVDVAGEAALRPDVRTLVTAHLAGWSGADPELGRGWIDDACRGLDVAGRAEARLALLVARAPWQVADGDVAAFRAADHAGDEALVGALAWGAFAAARRIGGWVAHADRDTAGRIC